MVHARHLVPYAPGCNHTTRRGACEKRQAHDVWIVNGELRTRAPPRIMRGIARCTMLSARWSALPPYAWRACAQRPGLVHARSLASAKIPPTKDDDNAESKKLTRWQQVKATFREHGLVFVGYYATTWTAGFGVCYGGVTLAGIDGLALIENVMSFVGANNYVHIDFSMFSPRIVNALIAAEMNELLEFVRLPFIIATTPALTRRWRGERAGTEDGQKKS